MSPTLQTSIVVVLVATCTVYAAWALMPAALRRPLAVVLQRWPLIGRLPGVARAAQSLVGCGCDGCDRSASAAKLGGSRATNATGATGTSVIRIVRRPPVS